MTAERVVDRHSLTEKLYISSIDKDCGMLARSWGLGVEIAEFCWAQYLDVDREAHIEKCRSIMEGVRRFRFHAPFAELAACAIDPKARKLAYDRYMESVDLSLSLGIDTVVIHGGFIPHVYFPEYYVSASVDFWKEFMESIPESVYIVLENVMEPAPETLVEIVEKVRKPNLGLCLDLGHANCDISKTPPEEWISPMAEHLKHVHIHNNYGTEDLHCPLGEGTIPMERILDRIMTECPEAGFTIENQHSEKSLLWLKERGYLI